MKVSLLGGIWLTQIMAQRPLSQFLTGAMDVSTHINPTELLKSFWRSFCFLPHTKSGNIHPWSPCGRWTPWASTKCYCHILHCSFLHTFPTCQNWAKKYSQYSQFWFFIYLSIYIHAFLEDFRLKVACQNLRREQQLFWRCGFHIPVRDLKQDSWCLLKKDGWF